MVDIEETKIGAHAILVNKDGKVILQQRDNNPGISNPGLIGLFGGSLRKDDSIENGLARELKEELELDLNKYSISKLGVYQKTKELDGLDYEAHVFIVKIVDENELKVHEGAGFVCDFSQNMLKSDKLARVARLVVEDYIKTVS